MLGIHKKPTDEVDGMAAKVAKSPLAASLIDGHVLYTDGEAWTWLEVPTQRWAFRADAERLNLVIDAASRLAAMRGKRLRIRVTSRPIDADQWAQGLAERTPDPLPGYAEHLAGVREHLSAGVGAEKRIYLGVRLISRPWASRIGDVVMSRPPHAQQVRANREAGIVAEALASAGIEATPLDSVGMEWLMRRSVELGMPTPDALSPVNGDGIWEAGDIHEIDEGVYHEGAPLADEIKVIGRGRLAGVERWVSVLTVGRVDAIDIPDPVRAPWLVELDRLPFGVEWSITLDILDGDQAKAAVQRKLLIVRDMEKHYHEHGLDAPLALDRQGRQARQVEDEMTTGQDVTSTRVHGWFRVAVWSESIAYEPGMDKDARAKAAEVAREQVRERVRVVVDRYRKRQVTIAHPKGQYKLLREFIPGEPLSNTAYVRRLPVLYAAAGMPQVSSSLGDGRGPFIGHTAGGRKAVMFDTHFATEVRETAGLVPIVGGLGAGKSVLEGLITYEAVRRGITSVMLDPSGPLARLCDLPELRDRSRHIDLTSAPSGTLNPYAVVAQPRSADYFGDTDALEEARTIAAQDRKLLALDVATMLLPAGLAQRPETRLLLTEAVRSTRGLPDASLWQVVEHLEQGATGGREIAAYLRDMAEMPLARLFFPSADRDAEGLDFDATLTVLTMPGLVLPPGSVPREHWSTTEQLAVPLLHLASWYATRTIYGRPRNERKVVALDETHFLGEWGSGRALFTRLARDSRKWNTCVLAASQNPADVLGMEVSNFISAAFVGRIVDEEVATSALRLLRVPTGVGFEETLARLSPRSSTAQRSGLREFVMRDVDGNVDRMRVDLDHLPQVLAALDTTAAPTARRTPGPEVRTLNLASA
jgi:hypothetical protein